MNNCEDTIWLFELESLFSSNIYLFVTALYKTRPPLTMFKFRMGVALAFARVLLSIYLIFCQFQRGVAYKSVAYKK